MNANTIINYLRNKKFILYFCLDVVLILISILIGYIFGDFLNIKEVKNESVSLSFVSIFTHNLTLSIILILGTQILSYPVITFNSFFLGINLNFAIRIYGIRDTINLIIYHTPIEIFGWLLTLLISKKMLTLYKLIYNKKNFLNLLRGILLYLFILIIIYLISSIIEANVIKKTF
ncbi:MAG: stage II sporulation protein M [Brockia lithotrophica]|nr:stage II sporulation protein M [Brockia lithotrophica]